MIIGAAGLAVSACSQRDAASEAPVTPLDGQYALIMKAGGTMGAMMPAKSSSSDARPLPVCIAGGHGDGLISTVLRRGGMLHPGCTHSPAPRVGNALSGQFICPTDPQRAPGGRFVLDYTGSVAENEVEASMAMTLDMPESALAGMSAEQRVQMEQAGDMMESVPINVVATRTGDCGG